ncbi:MAG: hypothetical protein ACR2NN_10060 [Bryobacteraceae bacterium]
MEQAVSPVLVEKGPTGETACRTQRSVSGHLEQMGTNGVEAKMAGQSSIGIERMKQPEACRQAVHHGRGNGGLYLPA